MQHFPFIRGLACRGVLILACLYSFPFGCFLCCYLLLRLLLSRFSRVRLCRPHRRQPTRLPRPWDSPGKNTGVGCHFLLRCMQVKSEREVAQSCLTLCDPMDCSPPGSSIHGIFQARVLEWGAIAFSMLLSNSPTNMLSGLGFCSLSAGHLFLSPLCHGSPVTG